jgi:rubrerythrin
MTQTVDRALVTVNRQDLAFPIALEWVCSVCGTQVRDQHPPLACHMCDANGTRFSQHQQLPGH